MKLDFSTKVLQIVKKIPKGKVSTYALIAKVLNNPKASRAVGNALKSNKKSYQNERISLLEKVPCHRVVRSDGYVGGYCGVNKSIKKKEILSKEGISISDDKIVDLDKYLYKF